MTRRITTGGNQSAAASLLSFMPRTQLAFIAPILLLASASAATPARAPIDPMDFFVGRTESVGHVKVMFHKDYGTHGTGEGRIEPDGSLLLVQQVFDDGKPARERRWHVRQTGPGRYAGSMSEASGPVAIEKVGDRYRFQFKMDGRLNVEEMMAPLPGGRSASSSAKIRKFGFVVATTEGIVRKIAGG
jgi:hypothetical protein